MNKQIREILIRFDSSNAKTDAEHLDRFKEAETAIKEYIEQEIIGEDETSKDMDSYESDLQFVILEADMKTRNRFREEQRDRLRGKE